MTTVLKVGRNGVSAEQPEYAQPAVEISDYPTQHSYYALTAEKNSTDEEQLLCSKRTVLHREERCKSSN